MLEQLHRLRYLQDLHARGEIAPHTTRVFETALQQPDFIPVVIATRGEQVDIQTLLISLSESAMPVYPIVADFPVKGDRTAEIAAAMGAHVEILDAPGKTGQLQAGVRYAFNDLGKTAILFTDADNLVQSTWAREMYASMTNGAGEEGIAVFGCSVYIEGGFAVDVLRSIRFVTKAAKANLRGTRPLVTGQNMAINFADNEAASQAYMSMNPNIFPGDDAAIYDTLVKSGMRTIGKLSLGSLTLTRGDRFSSVRQLVSEKLHHGSVKDASYTNQYGQITTAYVRQQ